MKLIFVTGGVLSGIGKGIAGASIGAILKDAGYRVFSQKLDGYLNVDPGTMNPIQHGEVFVTDDGAETDLDIGHYERFLDTHLNHLSSFTTGKLYEEIIARERKGEYLGGTVQIVPHLTDLVKEKIILGHKESGADISIIEIGGTIGDMENEYFLESARQLRSEYGKENVGFVHVALLPFLMASKELKTKPIQHSIRMLMSYGISPDFLVVRADNDIQEDILEKIASTSGLQRHQVISNPTLDTIYRIPIEFFEADVGKYILENLQLKNPQNTMKDWYTLINNIEHSHDIVTIGMVGKYVALEDAYYSLNEGLKCAGFAYKHRIKIRFIDAEKIEAEGTRSLSGLDGICIPGGFGDRGIDGMIQAVKYARENKIPYLGICLGSQVMAIEFARNVLGIKSANSAEFVPENTENVIHLMDTQKNIDKKGGTMRLGAYPCVLSPDTKVFDLYKKYSQNFEKKDGTYTVFERHRHRYEFNMKYRDAMNKKGFMISGTSPDGMLTEMVELRDHPFMVATQAHPEFLSRPTRPHPLLMGFIEAMI
ncbi:CTP synthetase [Candidatus Gracilibacteria bacterium]|nr:MAG: CTP synthetase [Candidatus Gracilibacteria bacterium]